MASAPGSGLPYMPDGTMFDICEKRVADMDKHGIDMQVVSCASQSQYIPATLAPSIVKAANDELADAIAKYPGRFAAFAALPWSDPEKAAQELERAVTKLGFKGAILSGRASAGKDFLDAPQFTPVLEAAQALDVPIYVHPAAPMRNVQQSYYDGLGDELSARLSLYGWGWHHEAGIQVLRMILSGAFEKFPNLQLIAGHWGEMVPFFLSRLDQALPQSVTKLNRTLTETFRQNVYVTPSGIFDYPQLKFCIEVLGADRIIHSVDFPFISNEGARPFIENAPISDEEKEKIAHGNAEALLGL
ncbi:MAG: amidohydrolase [Oscillospiraceae bacterium]|nr:amidohydrolase [Oscillospiraceae bacterium]